jgi:hypothetical protein
MHNPTEIVLNVQLGMLSAVDVLDVQMTTDDDSG